MTAQLDATSTEQVTEISWKGQQIALNELGTDELENLLADIDDADYWLGRRFQRDNISSKQYRRMLADNDEVRRPIITELHRRNLCLCADCGLMIVNEPDSTCKVCWEAYQYVD